LSAMHDQLLACLPAMPALGLLILPLFPA
jgi:hypothetical protein